MANSSLLIAGSLTQFTKLKFNMDKAKKGFRAYMRPETSSKYLKKSSENGATNSILDSLQLDPVKQKKLAIAQKLKSGKRLSQVELDWLEENAPELYEKAKKIMEARDDYRQRLRDCRTKQEVAMAKAGAMSDIHGQIPSTADADVADTLLMHIAALHDEHVGYTSSNRYKNLPERDPLAQDLEDERLRDKQKRQKRGDTVGI